MRALHVWSPPLIMRNTNNVILAGLTHAHFLLCGVLCVVVFLIFFLAEDKFHFLTPEGKLIPAKAICLWYLMI